MAIRVPLGAKNIEFLRRYQDTSAGFIRHYEALNAQYRVCPRSEPGQPGVTAELKDVDISRPKTTLGDHDTRDNVGFRTVL